MISFSLFRLQGSSEGVSTHSHMDVVKTCLMYYVALRLQGFNTYLFYKFV